VNNFAANNQKH